MNRRIAALRECALTTYVAQSPEWERLWKEGLARSEGEPDVIREARALTHAWQNRCIEIRDDELIVGAAPGLHYGTAPSAAICFGRQGFAIPWFPVPASLEPFFRDGLVSMAGNHTTLDYVTIMDIGFDGLLDRVARRKERLLRDEPQTLAKVHFLDALTIVAQGYIGFCHRYADLAATMSLQAADPQRRGELDAIAGACRRVIASPPRTFKEACQAAWFAFLYRPDAPGRLDQYLYPFYRQDLDRGLVSADDAREWLGCLWLRYFQHSGATQAVSALHHMTLGGVKPDGTDASNDLTWLCLEVTQDLGLQRPQVGLRCHRGTPPALLKRATEVLRARAGNPDFCNDEQIVPALVHTGIPVEDARDFSLSGCHEVIVTGKAQMGSVEGFINMPKILRTVLGLEPGIGAGADLARFTSFEALWDALEAAMDSVAATVHEISVARDRHAAASPDLCTSLVVNDCIEKVSGYTQGGARYNHCNWDVIGLANLADSLAAIRRMAFEDRTFSLGGIIDLLRSNWEGQEPLRCQVINAFPHFGNDDDDADLLAVRIVERFAAIMKRRTPFRGGQYILGTTAGGENMHIEFGRVCGATPDGRRAGDPLADSMGAAQGRDRRGVTALLNSVAKLPHRLLPTAATLNVRLDPKLIESADGVAKIAALIRSHFLTGGQQIQFNLVSRDMLLEARRHPEQHSGLMVRVAGYSAPFTSLWVDLQDEIISRTEHAACG